VSGRLSWSAGFGLVGLAVSAYLVGTHYFSDAVPLACATAGIVNCEQVTTSAASMIGPVPVAVLGFVWFLGYLGVLGARFRLADNRMLAAALLGWSAVGLLVVFYLIYAELFLIGAICAWCTVVHGVVIALFLLSVWDVTTPASATGRWLDSGAELG
jgi:uncharacterized membrane protein